MTNDNRQPTRRQTGTARTPQRRSSQPDRYRESTRSEGTARYRDSALDEGSQYRDQTRGESAGRYRDQARDVSASQYRDQTRDAGAAQYRDQARYSRTSRQGAAAQYSDTSRYSSQARSGQSRNSASRYESQTQSGNARRSNRSSYAARQASYNEAVWNDNPQGYDDAARYNDYSRYTSAGGYNSLYNPGKNESAAKSKAPLITGIVVGVIVLAALLWFFVIPKPFEVTVNGKEVTVDPGSTVATLVEKGYVRPAPGNLVAVDGSLLAAGEGEPFSATINDSPAATDAKLAKDMVVEIGNGGDRMEDYTTSETPVPFDTVNDDMGFESYWSGSIHLLQDGKDGMSITKTGAISGKTVAEVTQQPVSGGYHIYTAQPNEKVIALTFDDGPWPGTTNEILDILQANGAKATFFTIGNQISSEPDTIRRAVEMGCEVCTHSFDHADGSGNGVDLTLMSSNEQIEEVTQGYAAIASVTGTEPSHIMRAPGGNFHDDIIMTLWPYVDAEIGWDVDTEDWSKPGVEAIASRILSAEPGDVILMHDGGGDREQTVEALRQALPTLVQRGYKFVTMSEMLSYGMPNQAAAPAPAAAGQGADDEEYGYEGEE